MSRIPQLNPNKAISPLLDEANGLLRGALPNQGGQSVPSGFEPWSSLQRTEFFPSSTKIDPNRWDKAYPYKLMVIDARTNAVVVGSDPDGSGSIPTISEGTNGEFVATIERPNRSWQYTFPITPSSIATDTAFAINISAQQQGVLEEHGGVVFKDLAIRGTFGIFPGRKSAPGLASDSNSFISQVLESTLPAAEQLSNSFNRLKNFASSNTPYSKPESTDPDSSELVGTGYYQALYLDRFLEQYALAKKDPAKTHWRLVFWNQKENVAYAVTPLRYSSSKSVDSPHEYKFSLNLRAFRRINLDVPVYSPESGLARLQGIGFYQKAFETVRLARETLSSSVNLVKAVRSDFRRPFELLRQVTQVIKQGAGLALTAADLPNAIVDDAKDLLAQSNVDLQIASESLSAAADTTSSYLSKSGRAKSISLKNKSTQNEGVVFGKANSAVDSATDAAFNSFRNPEANFSFLDSIDLSGVPFNSSQLDRLDRDLLEIESLTVDRLKSQADELRSLALDIANQYGAGDVTLNQILGLPAPKTRAVPMSIDESAVLDALNGAIIVYDQLTATTLIDTQKALNPIQYVQALATENGLPFADIRSKILVPVPFGASLEQISARYLGDPARWFEIATLNALRAPYIDETGYALPILSNAEDRQLIVARDERLYVGQKLTLSSSTVFRFFRTIINLEEVGQDSYLVTLDGDANLGILKTADNAQIRGYLGGTVNSQDQIFIPVEGTPNVDNEILPPDRYQNDAFVAMSKVDILLGEDGDVKFDPLGDFRLAAGLTNLTQALRTIVSNRPGDDINDPTLGINVGVGQSVADVSASEILKQIESQVAADPRFAGLSRLDVVLDGPALSIKMVAEVAGNNGIVPVEFVFKR